MRDEGTPVDRDGLDFSPYTYEQLRDAVLGVNEEAIRVGANEWSDLKRRLNERIGALRIMIHKLEPEWDSAAGRQALNNLRDHQDYMEALARTARINQDRYDELYETYSKAVKDIRELHKERGGQAEVASNPGGNEPLPPNLADRRQPKATEIANALYGKMAVTSASLSMPQDTTRDHTGDGGGNHSDSRSGTHDTAPGAGSGRGSNGPSRTPGTQTSAAPPPSKAGSPGPVFAGPPPSGVTPTRGANAPGRAPATATNPAGGGSGAVPGVARFSATAGSGLGTGGATGRGAVGATGSAANSTSGPGGTGSGGKVLGGGPRPVAGGPGGPGEAAPGSGRPTHPGGMPGGAGGAGGPGGGGQGRRTNYERGDPDLFRSNRQGAKPVIGQQAAQPKPVAAGPGVLGQQKQKPAEAERQEPKRPKAAPAPEGFPDKLESGTFKGRDGTQFSVRRRASGK